MVMKPRVLYFVVFVYISLGGGRFTATFLEHELQFTENWMISSAMAIQLLSSGLCSTWLGGYADSLAASSKGSSNRGRLRVMSLGLLWSTIITLMHILGSLWMKWSTTDLSQPTIPTAVLAYHLLLRALRSVGSSACIPILDGLTLAQLEREGCSKKEYGKERAYGAISWGIAHILFGPAIDMFGFKILYVTVVLAFIGCIVTFQLYDKSTSTIEYDEVGQKTGVGGLAHSYDDEEKKSSDEASPLLKQTQKASQYQSTPGTDDGMLSSDNSNVQSAGMEVSQERLSFTQLAGLFFQESPILNMSYMICMFTLFIGMSVVEKLIFLYFEFLGGTNTMCGLTVIVTVIFEIPLFQNSPKVLKSLGCTWMLQLACLAYVVRVIGYSFIPENHPYLVLFLEPLHGITIAFAFTSCVAFADQNVPSGYESSGQGFMSMIRSFGMFVGLCIGGFVEGRALYRLLALIVALGSLALGIGTYSAMKSQKLSNQSSTSGEQST